MAQRIEDLLANWDVNDPSAYPYEDFDADGLPIEPVAAVPGQAPARLDQNYPNPFNPVTTIGFHLARADRVTLAIYDLGGHKVRTLLDDDLAPRQLQRGAGTGAMTAAGTWRPAATCMC